MIVKINKIKVHFWFTKLHSGANSSHVQYTHSPRLLSSTITLRCIHLSMREEWGTVLRCTVFLVWGFITSCCYMLLRCTFLKTGGVRLLIRLDSYSHSLQTGLYLAHFIKRWRTVVLSLYLPCKALHLWFITL